MARGQDYQKYLLPERTLDKIVGEASGKICFEHIRDLSVFCKWYGSDGMQKAAELILSKAKDYGLTDARIERFEVDENTYYWMQKPWLAWNCELGELRMKAPLEKLITSYEADCPCVLVNSRNTDVEAEVVYVGSGTESKDYEGKDVGGKIVLAYGDPWEVSQMAVLDRGAAGILTALRLNLPGYTSNTIIQTRIKPWNKEKTRSSTFGFFLSTNQAREILNMLEKGEKVVVEAKVKAEVRVPGFHPGVVATIPGSTYPDEEIIFTAHLDHPRPGAHDNNSGCAVLLETARLINSLVSQKMIEPPKRTLRFYWNPHVWGAEMLFSTYPELLRKTIADINVDCVGLDQTKISSALTVVLPPYTRASYIGDIFGNILNYLLVNNNSEIGDLGYDPKVIDHDGTRNVLNGRTVPFSGYTDHVFFNSGNVGIPAVNLIDLPFGSHHSQNDKSDFLDPTQLKRYVVLAAAAAYAISSAGPGNCFDILDEVYHSGRARLEKERRLGKSLLRGASKKTLAENFKSAENLLVQSFKREEQALASTKIFIKDGNEAASHLGKLLNMLKMLGNECLNETREAYARKCMELKINAVEPSLTSEEMRLREIVPVPHPELKGTFGELNEYPVEKYQLKDIMPDEPFYYELFNLMDGHRNLLDIYRFVQAEALSAGYKGLTFPDILNFLRLLKEADVLVSY